MRTVASLLAFARHTHWHFSVCTFVIPNYVNLNIGLTLTLYQSVGLLHPVGNRRAAIGLIYKHPSQLSRPLANRK